MKYVGPNIQGVFPLTPYPSFNKYENIVYKLFYLNNFKNETLMLDFNDSYDRVLNMKSTITFFGVETSNMKYGVTGLVY